jgi:hypothetical protein
LIAVRRLLLILVLASWQALPWAGESIAVVAAAGSRLDKLSLDTVKLIFKRKSMVNAYGDRWIPVNLPPAHPLRRIFSLAVFDALPEDMEEYWNEQYFQGINPPEVLSSEEAVLRFVAATPAAIGYVRQAQADARVKILLRIPSTGDLGEPP